jgi:hypothetical protein
MCTENKNLQLLDACVTRKPTRTVSVVTCKFSTFKAQWLLYTLPGLTSKNSTFCSHSVFMFVIGISEKTATTSMYNINRQGFFYTRERV